MSFFATEKSTSRLHSKPFSYSNDRDALLQREFTIDGQNGFHKSPYELFRENVAKYCDRFMLDSFEDSDCMSAEEKASFAYRNCCRRCPARQESSVVIRDMPSRDSSAATTETSNAFSFLSVSFEPADKDEPNTKLSFLKRISKLMNSYSSNKMSLTHQAELKQHRIPQQWNACECHVHIGKHSNCCQCQEPYHRTSCDCVQHSGSHSYCCRCDIRLLQEYDQYLKKKKYLRLYPGEEDNISSPIPTHMSSVNPSRPSTSHTDKSSWCEDRGLFTQEFFNDNIRRRSPGVTEFPKENTSYQSGASDKVYSWKKDCDAQCENGEEHPCESCCKKLDDIYGSALREVHSMLVDVSRSLAPAMNCCTMDTLIRDSLLRQRPLYDSINCSQDYRRSGEVHEAPEFERPSHSMEEPISYPKVLHNRRSDVAIQVDTYSQEPAGTPRAKRSKFSLVRKMFKKKEKCVIS